MARQLGPDLFGLVAIVMIFIDIAQGLTDFGFSQALIRKQSYSPQDCNSVFLFNVLSGGVIYLLLLLCKSGISAFFGLPALSQIIPWLGPAVVFNAFSVVQRSVLTSRLDFRTQTKASLLSTLISGIVGLTMVFSGYGVASLVALYLLRSFFNSVLLWVFNDWRPSFLFSLSSLKEMAAFSSPLAIAGLLDSFYTNGIGLIIGKAFNASDLAFFNRARQFASLPSSNITNVVQKVSYPALCKISEDSNRLATAYKKYLLLSVALLFPVMGIIGALASPIVNLLLGPEWSFTAILLMILAPAMMWYPVHAINLNLLLVAGRSNLFLKVEILKKITGITLIALLFSFGIIYVAAGILLSSLLALVYNTFYTRRLIGLGLLRQLKLFLPVIVMTIIISGLCFMIVGLSLPNWITLLIAVPLSAALYLIMLRMVQPVIWGEFISLIQHIRRIPE